MNKVMLGICVVALLGVVACLRAQDAVVVHTGPSPGNGYRDLISTGEPVTLRVMTFNIHYGEGKDKKQDLSRIAELIREADPDIVGLQEVDSFQPRSQFVNQAKWLAEELGMYGVYGPNLVLGVSQYGNAILSRYPIVSFTNISLPSGWEPRGCLKAEIDIGGRRLVFLSTHLGLSEDERLEQADSVVALITESELPVVLVGDLNNTPGSGEVQKISSALVDAFGRLGRLGEPTFAYGTSKPNVRIDYVFVSPDIGVKNAQTIKTSVSDHLPVVVDIVVP